MKRILVTGASGFIGSFIVEEALARGMEVWAAVRKSSSRAFLTDERIHFIHLSLHDPILLRRELESHAFDYVVHAAGVTKSLHEEDFHRVNTNGTQFLVEALLESSPALQRFVYLSSLSIFGPIREQQPYTEITDSDTPQPNTAYGRSKLEAEQFLDRLASYDQAFPYVVLRPTGVYGPRERDYFMMAKSISRHVDFAAGYQPQDITFVYVTDVVQAVFLALDHGRIGGKYFLSDGEVYQSRTFSDLLRRELGNPWLLRIKAPLWLLRVVTTCGELWGRITGKVTALNNDKYHIMKQRNWRCDITPVRNELGYRPQVGLEEGVRRSVAWYKENKWL
ncbi:MAG: NAD(P)-dependent oxidoreductase [Prevotella sp.]|nr:NAD(P)-dependent oxidoreductase [Prevotella sp.]